MCKFCIGILTGVVVCLACLVIGWKLVNGGITGPSAAAKDNLEPVPELAEPVPVSQESDPPAKLEIRATADLSPPAGPATPAATPSDAVPDSPPVTAARHQLPPEENPPSPEPPRGPEPLPSVPSPDPIARPPATSDDRPSVPPPTSSENVASSPPPATTERPPDPVAVPEPPPPAGPEPAPPPPVDPPPPEPLPAQREPAVASAPAPPAAVLPAAPEPVVPRAEKKSGLRVAVRPVLSIHANFAGTAGATPEPAPLLTGSHSCTVDDAHRVELPAAVREQLGEVPALMATPGPNQCLLFSLPADLPQVLEQLSRAGKDEEAAGAVRRLYFSRTEKVAIDGGRLTIPKGMAEQTGVRGEAVLIGVGDHLELWSTQRWRQYLEQNGAAERPSPASAP